MKFDLLFITNSALLGLGLAMDAFSVSLANGLNEPKMKRTRMVFIAMVYAIFQAIMPLTGWLCVHSVVCYFKSFEKLIPWIALILLLLIGGKMLIEGIKGDEEDSNSKNLTLAILLLQGVATSIDALSVGFTIAEYGFIMALLCAIIIATVTFVTCFIGLHIGKKFGMKLAGRATILGGLILIFIGIEIFVKGVF
jgi:putative Mn2+ efflux pump MntP